MRRKPSNNLPSGWWIVPGAICGTLVWIGMYLAL